MSKLSGLVYDYGDLQVSFAETEHGVQLIFLAPNGVTLQGLRWELVADLVPYLSGRLAQRAADALQAVESAARVVKGPWPDKPAEPSPPEAA